MIGTLDRYRELEDRIKKNDLDGLLARWEFGKKLLEERGEAGRLPNGRLEELHNALCISRSEISHRMRFAKRYPSEADAKAALEEHESWFGICQIGLYAPDAEDLAERGALDLADLAGLSEAERKMVVGEAWRFYDIYCHDEAHDKDPILGIDGEQPAVARTLVTINPGGIRWLTHRAIGQWRKLQVWKPSDPDQKYPDQKLSDLERKNVEELNRVEVVFARQRLTAEQFRRWLRPSPYSWTPKPPKPRVEVEAATELAQEAATDNDVPVRQPVAPITPLDSYKALAQRFIRQTRTLLTEPHGLLEERVMLDAEQSAGLRALVRSVRQALDEFEENVANVSLTSVAS
ncbi:MAG TPA: hypothetical protein VI504_00225 [Candidatus Eisenbacteria bacterium]